MRAAIPNCTAFNVSASTLLIALAACTSSAPPDDSVEVPDTVLERAAGQETYFEGSRRMWEDARERGVRFRAIGQEPGWLLDIDSASMILSADYGERRIVVPAPEPVVGTDGTTVYSATGGRNGMRVTVRSVPCTDVMSGEQFSMTVSVEVVPDGVTYHGCGRALDGLP